MQIVWDEPKRLANIDKHGLDFADLTESFFEQAAYFGAKQGRVMAIGKLEGNGVVTVVFGRLGSEGVAVISMRVANAKERNLP